MQLVRSSAKVGDTNAEALYYLAIASARKTIELTAAYFVPRPAFTDALCAAAERGVEVRIVVPGPHIDKGFVRVAGRAAYDAAARSRVCSCSSSSRRCCMRSRSASTAPGRRSGSVNFDNRSFQLHDEVTLCVWDSEFASRLHEAFERDISKLGRDRAGALGRPHRPSARRRARHHGPSPRALTRLSCGACSIAVQADPPGAHGRAAARPPDRPPQPGARRARRRRSGRAAVPAHPRTRASRSRPSRRRSGSPASTARSGPGSARSAPRSTRRRRGQWLLAGASGPAAVGVNFAVKVAVGRQRPLIEDHPPLAKAPTKLSFPSAHATSSVAAATALGRVAAARAPVPVRARRGDLRRPPLPRHALPVRRARRRRARRLRSARSSRASAPRHAEERLFELAVDANERAQANQRASGNGGAVAVGEPGDRREDRHRRPAERRQVDALQRAHPGRRRDRRLRVHDDRPERRRSSAVPDERLEQVAATVGSSEVVHETIEFHDIAGLVPGAAQGEGLGNQFLAAIRETDAICHVVRCHDSGGVPHPEGRVDPGARHRPDRDRAAGRRPRAGRAPARAGDQAGAARATRRRSPSRPGSSRWSTRSAPGTPVREVPVPDAAAEAPRSGCSPLTSKPILYVANVDEGVDEVPPRRSPRTPAAPGRVAVRDLGPGRGRAAASSTTRTRRPRCAPSWGSPSRACRG